MYKTLDEILADIGKSNVTPKHLIKAAYDLGAGVEEGEEELEIMENNAKVLEEVEEGSKEREC